MEGEHSMYTYVHQSMNVMMEKVLIIKCQIDCQFIQGYKKPNRKL
jgi:hypothetical protein